MDVANGKKCILSTAMCVTCNRRATFRCKGKLEITSDPESVIEACHYHNINLARDV